MWHNLSRSSLGGTYLLAMLRQSYLDAFVGMFAERLLLLVVFFCQYLYLRQFCFAGQMSDFQVLT
jgi:hypothetical protein